VNTSVNLTTSVLTDEAGFDALAGEWDELLEQSEQHVFFLRYSWNRLWWRFLRPASSELFIITCRDQHGRLVGLAPFYLRQRRTAGIPHVREILFLGTGVYAQTSEHLDVISRRGFELSVADAIADCLSLSSDWDRLCLTEIPEASRMLACLQSASSEQNQIEACNRSHFIDTTVGWDSFTKGLSGSARRNVVSGTRKLFSGHECKLRRVETPDELEPAMNSLVRLHQARWQSKGEPGAFALPNVEAFLREAARASLAEGRLRLLTLEVDGKIAAARLDFLDNHTAHAFQAGFDPAYANEALGAVMNGLCIKQSIEDEWVHAYDFMGGSAEYKESWTSSYKSSVSLTLVRPGTRSTTYRSLEMAKAVGKTLARATIPESIRLAGHRLITQRHYK
jgi:CelD/BcsL family acetyltransferase involved in cellulose biosynthesis